MMSAKFRRFVSLQPTKRASLGFLLCLACVTQTFDGEPVFSGGILRIDCY